MSNRRRSERYAVTLPVAIKWPDGIENTLTANVSAHGIAVFTTRRGEAKQYVQVELAIPPARQVIAVTAMVARATQRLEDRSGLFHPGIAFDLYLFEGQGRAVWRTFIERMRAAQHESVENPPPVPLSSAPPPGGNPDPEPAATFSIKPRDVGRLWSFLRAELLRGKARIETPVLKPIGSPVELLVIHPDTNNEWILRGTVTLASEVGRGRGPMLEIGIETLSEEDRNRFREFVQTGDIPPSARAPIEPSVPPEAQATQVGVKAVKPPVEDIDTDPSVAHGLRDLPLTTSEQLALPEEATDERAALDAAPAIGVIPSKSFAPTEAGTFASFFHEFAGDKESTTSESMDAQQGETEEAVHQFDSEEETSPENASLHKPMRSVKVPSSSPPPAVVALPSSRAGGARVDVVAKSLSRPPPPPPPDDEEPRAVHRFLSTEGSNPELDRDVALARARVVRTPDSATAVYQLGRLLLRRGGDAGVKEALKILERCVQIEPNHPGAHYSAAEAFADRGMFDAADEHLRRARRLGYRIDVELERRISAGLRKS